jgi:thiamine-monophosphate kinase
MTLTEVGFRAMAVNLSDLAAAGAAPDSAIIQIIFPRHASAGDFRAIYRGVNSACRCWNFPVVGGDVAAGPCWVLAITMIGRARGRTLTRTGARHGDSLWVTGYPGASAAGMAAILHWGRRSVPRKFRGLVNRHVRPVPRIKAGLLLAADTDIHACIDVSDGISKECHTLAYENQLGIVLQRNALPVMSAMIQLGSTLQQRPAAWFLHGGEDYELLFAANQRFDDAAVRHASRLPVTRIGRFCREVLGVWVESSDGRRAPLANLSWDHIGKRLRREHKRL